MTDKIEQACLVAAEYMELEKRAGAGGTIGWYSLKYDWKLLDYLLTGNGRSELERKLVEDGYKINISGGTGNWVYLIMGENDLWFAEADTPEEALVLAVEKMEKEKE